MIQVETRRRRQRGRQVPDGPRSAGPALLLHGGLLGRRAADRHRLRPHRPAADRRRSSSWPVDQIVNTHSHEDHIGANAQVQALFRCPILAHPDALPILQNPRLQPLQLYRRLFWGWPKPSAGEPPRRVGGDGALSLPGDPHAGPQPRPRLPVRAGPGLAVLRRRLHRRRGPGAARRATTSTASSPR